MNREVICFDAVAPARERGLKLCFGLYLRSNKSRSREGAWIEMYVTERCVYYDLRRSREGAWIEIKIRFLCCGEYGGRSREGAWIEIVYSRSC